MDPELDRAYHAAGLNLSLVPLDDLLDEVKRRFDACVIAGDLRLVTMPEEQRGEFTWAAKGSPLARLGIAHALVLMAQDDVREEFGRPCEESDS